MSASLICPKCGQQLPADAPRGVCPDCLLGLLEGETRMAPGPHCGQESSAPRRANRFGDYELIEEIARGGMGMVYKARQISLDRIVAVKMILGGLATKEFVQRFRTEAATAASLHHPNIVGIHEVGMHDGEHFLAMDYVDGPNLAKLIGQHPLPPPRAARYVKLIAEAVHFAHERHILHRDLKPANVLIDSNDQPHISDFGLAKRLNAETDLTLTGQVLGSPNFMPPEQASGSRGKLGRHSDVYGLGGILYFALTAHAPFQADSLEGVVRQVLGSEPVSPRLLNPSVPRDLETICLKCLEKESARRYHNAQEVAEELQRFLQDEPIRSRPVTGLEKVWRWSRRKPALATALGVVLLLLLIVGIGSPIALLRIDQARQGEHRERLRAERSLYAAEMNLAHEALQAGNLGRARELLERQLPSVGSQGEKGKRGKGDVAPSLLLPVSHFPSKAVQLGWEWFYLLDQCRGDEIATLGRHHSEVVGVTFVGGGKQVLSGSADGVVRVWDIDPRREAAHFSVGGNLRSLSVSPDGLLLATLSEQGGAKVWDLQHGRELVHYPAAQGPIGGTIAFSPDGALLAMSLEWGKILLTDVKSTERRYVLAGEPFQVRALAFSADGNWLASGGEDRLVKLWNPERREQIVTLPGHAGWIACLAFSPDGQFLASGASDRTIRIWQVGTGQLETTLTNNSALVWSMAFSPDGQTLLTGGADQRVRLWDTATWRETVSLRGHESEVRSVAFSQDGVLLATGGKDQTVKLWSESAPPIKDTRLVLPTDTDGAVLSADGRRLVAGNIAGQCQAWQLPDLTKLGAFKLPPDFTTIALDTSGKTFYSADASGLLRAWDMDSGRESWSVNAFEARIEALATSRDDRIIAIGGASTNVRLWSLSERREMQSLTMPFPRTWALTFSSDARRLAVASTDHTVSVWDVASSTQLASFTGHAGYVNDLAFSPDDRLLASASWDGTAKLFDLGSQREIATLRGSLLGINSVAFAGNGQRLFAGTSDGSIKVWELNQYREVLTLRGHDQPVQIGFLAHGQTLVSFSKDLLRLWPVPSLETGKAHPSSTPEWTPDKARASPP